MTQATEQHDTQAPFWTGTPDAAAFEALQRGRLDRARALLDRMRRAPGSRTIENTLVPFDDAGFVLDLVASQSSLIENVHPDEALRAAAERSSQQAAALVTELSLDHRCFEALAALDVTDADPETGHYVARTLRDFRLAGVDRDEATRARVARLREELVEVGQAFSRNIRSDLRSVSADGVAELAGLPPDFIARHPAGPDGRITLTIDYPDALPVFAYAESEPLRRRLHHEFSNRAHPQNLTVLHRMLSLRHELATLLGFRHWADYATADKMSGSGHAASEFVDRIVELSGARADRDYAQLLARKRGAQPGADAIHQWESAFWSERVRRAEYDFDAQSVRPYFPYARVKQGVLDLASRLYGIRFARVPDAPVWHPAVECWEMWQDGALAGRFYLDMHPRRDKYSHAAEFDVRAGARGRSLPEATLVCNFPGGDERDPGLMEHSDVRTLFHEFGHLLHALIGGHRRWAGIGGIRAEHDFIEVPSQLFEEWAWDPRVLATFAHHHQTGEPIPADRVLQMKRASEFGKGLGVRRQMVYARVSLSYHDRDPATLDTDAVMAEISRAYQPFPLVADSHTQCAFGHLEGYSALYYAYMWSLVISKDVFSRFDAADLLDPRVARRYRDLILAPGGSRPAAQMVEEFLGRPFGFEAYRAWLESGS